MAPLGAPYHFALSLVTSFGLCALASRSSDRPSLEDQGLVTLLTALALGEAKESYDLLTNHWCLNLADLRADSMHDRTWNVIGTLAGILLWAVTIRLAKAVRVVCEAPQ